jgi:hypothetical protein
MAGEVNTAAEITARRVRGPGTTVEDNLRYLLELAQESQERLSKLEQDVADLPRRWGRDVERIGRELRAELDHAIAGSEERHIGIRLAGVVLLLVGVPILAIANFV